MWTNLLYPIFIGCLAEVALASQFNYLLYFVNQTSGYYAVLDHFQVVGTDAVGDGWYQTDFMAGPETSPQANWTIVLDDNYNISVSNGGQHVLLMNSTWSMSETSSNVENLYWDCGETSAGLTDGYTGNEVDMSNATIALTGLESKFWFGNWTTATGDVATEICNYTRIQEADDNITVSSGTPKGYLINFGAIISIAIGLTVVLV